MENVCTIRQVYRKPRQAARCGAGSAQPAKKRTCRTRRHGFLTHTFTPFWAFDGNKARAEKEYFCSLANICAYYDLLAPNVSHFAFPQNIYQSWEIIAGRIRAIDKRLECIIVGDGKHVATLATIRRYDTGMTLYYIPVKPLWNWTQQAKQQDMAELLIVIFAYLYQVVQVPFFSEQGSYLKQQYGYLEEMISEDMEQDEEEDAYRQEQLDEIYTLQNAGVHLYRQISSPERLEKMEAVIKNYSHFNERNNDWAILSIEFLQLYQQYPARSFFDNIRPDLLHPETTERICAEQYISFYWSGNDCFQDSLFDMINCEFQEKEFAEEPVAVELFDTMAEKSNENFGFETRLLALINRLCELLSKHDYDRR